MKISQVNRHLENTMMDHMDHALGRPVDPMNRTHFTRNYFGTDCEEQGAEFLASGFWEKGRSIAGTTWYHVNDAGRAALASHLKEIGDEHRLFEVTRRPEGIESYSESVAAKSHSAARYAFFCDLDLDVPFVEFCKSTSVRLSRVTEYRAA